MNTPTEIIALSPRAAAAASSLSLRTVMQAIASGELPSTKLGRRRLVFRQDLEWYLRSAGSSPTAPKHSPATQDHLRRRSGTRQRG
jgi:excisionase family DNA binding protein